MNDLVKLNTMMTGKWMIHRDYLNAALMTFAVGGGELKAQLNQMPVEDDEDETAIIEVSGMLMKNFSFAPLICDYTDIINDARSIGDDEKVKVVGMYFDSPGGTVVGLEEAVNAVKELSAKKTTIAYCDRLCCSAAYALAVNCSYIYAAPSALTVNVGEIYEHVDASGLYKAAGLNITTIASGKFKALEGTDNHTLTQEEMKMITESVDKDAQEFREMVMALRGVDDTHIQGLAYSGKEAAQYNLVDGCIDTYEDFKSLLRTLNK